MTITYFPFDDGNGKDVTEAQWSQMARLWRPSGVVPSDEGQLLNALEVYGDSSGMQVKVKSGEFWLKGHYLKNDAEYTVAIAAAHATLDRIDLIAVEVDWTNNTMGIVAVTGTAAGSPSEPSLTQTAAKWQIAIARVDISAAAATIAAVDVTDYRSYSTLKRCVNFQWLIPTGSLTTGDSKAVFTVPREFHRWKIVKVQAHVVTVSSSGTPTFQIHRVRSGVSQDILSTALTIDANEKDSSTAATPAVLNSSYVVMEEGDEFHVDCDTAGTGTKGPNVQMMIIPPEA